MRQNFSQLAKAYFSLLARRYPVMCASDEFYLMPRSREAITYLDEIDNLSSESIVDTIEQLEDLQRQLHQISLPENDLEMQIDREFLTRSISCVLTELAKHKTWRVNPLLYLKIAFIGLDHALHKPSSDRHEIRDRTISRLAKIPTLLLQAQSNLGAVPVDYHRGALAMISDCRRYLDEIKLEDSFQGDRVFELELTRVRQALTELDKFLKKAQVLPSEDFFEFQLDEPLHVKFGSALTLREIFEIAEDEWRENLDELRRLQSQIDPGKTWVELYHSYIPPGLQEADTFSLYRGEMERLRGFFKDFGFPGCGSIPLPSVQETPTYLRSIRASASFCAAFSSDPRELDLFFITTAGQNKNGSDLRKKRLNREFRFLCAHETYPGHHLLDFTRRRLENPVRAQIESPLFYEGWAYYVETLLDECGYVEHPLDRLVDRKRRLWRAARCKIESGMAGGFLEGEEAENLLVTVGFSPREARDQMARFRLNPGYQVCYTLGRYEIMRLREKYQTRVTRDNFHRELLHGGELPFALVEKRLDHKLGI